MFQLKGDKSEGGILAVGIFPLGGHNDPVAIFSGRGLIQCFETACGKVGCGKADAGFLGFTGCKIELKGGGLVKVLGSKHLTKPVGPGCGELARLELHHELLIGGAGSGCISRHAVALGQAEERGITGGRGRVGDKECLILGDSQIVKFAGVEVVRTIQSRLVRRGGTGGWGNTNILRVVRNHRY